MAKNKVADRFFRLAVEHAFNHVVITDVDGLVVYANQSVEKITGFKISDVLGSTPRLWGRQMKPAFYKKLWKTIKIDKKPFRGEVVNRRKNGEIYFAIATISPILDEQKKLLGFIGIEEDVTERKLYAEKLENEVARRTTQLNKKVKELTQLKKEKDDFITSASHQLRTPASVIRMQLDILKKESIGFPKAKGLLEELEVLAENNKRAIDIMDDLFKVIELGEGYEACRLEPANIKDLIDQILDSYDEQIKKKQLRFSISVPKTIELKVDKNRIKNVLINLIDNAITYSNEKGQIKIQAVKKQKEVIISVEDKGIGIPKSEQIKVFDKFFRAKNSYLKKTVGTGLGLIIAKIIVEGHSGTLDFESEEGKGSLFIVKLPRRK